MNKIYKVSLFPLILACVSSMPVDARVTTNNSNRSYANAYQQVNAMRYQQETATATTASATANLPVMVSDEKLAAAIVDGTAEGVTVSDLDSCAMIYPSGVFRWEIPQSGVRRNQIPQCVSVVELRDATTNAVLATTTVAAGDTFKCNVDSFPESGLSFDLKYGKIEVPADVAPTMEDVEAIMNEEQRQNAGLKIAAGAILGGVAGNFLAPKQAGDSKMFGIGQTQLIDTAIGTAAGAGIMAASSYSGKVAGDTIKSTAVNAASGMVLGNMLAGMSGGDSILATSKCLVKDGTESKEKDCILGTIYKKSEKLAIEGGVSTEENKSEKHFFINITNLNEMLECDENGKNCSQASVSQYTDIVCKTSEKDTSLCKNVKKDRINKAETFDNLYKLENTTSALIKSSEGVYMPVESAYKVKEKKYAFAVFDDNLPVKGFGYKFDDWAKDGGLRGEGAKLENKGHQIYIRKSNGTPGDLVKKEEGYTFEPNTRDADDGALIDMSNQARAKATIAGTAAGGAMGGFAGYQGAKDEVSQRWVAAVREYEDSLSNFVCSTGTRFLSKYNDYVEIPELKKSDQ